MNAPPESLTQAAPQEIVDSIAFALRYSGRKRVSDASEMMAAIVAKRLVEHLSRSGFVVMRRPPAVGAAALGSEGTPHDPATMSGGPG
ncbi:MAG: hypothetical protein ACLPN5_12505 [Roseiarcus sp.]